MRSTPATWCASPSTATRTHQELQGRRRRRDLAAAGRAMHVRGKTTQDGGRRRSPRRSPTAIIRDPNVAVEIETYRPFFIQGAVKTAGQFPYVYGMTVRAAISTAGGFTETADRTRAIIYRRQGKEMVKGTVELDFPIYPGDTIVVLERWLYGEPWPGEAAAHPADPARAGRRPVPACQRPDAGARGARPPDRHRRRQPRRRTADRGAAAQARAPRLARHPRCRCRGCSGAGT